MGAPFVSVIVLNYNGLVFVEHCVRSVLESDYPGFEVVVVDNGSTDGSYEALCQSFSQAAKVRIVRNDRNLGFALGNNVGYRSSRGDIVAFLNMDTVVERTWLRELVDALISNNKVGAAHSRQMSLKNKARLESLGAYMDPLGFVYPRAWWAREQSPLGRVEEDEPFYPDGGSMALRRSAIEKVAIDGQPFDGDYFLYFEDNDLGWRLRLGGYRIVCVPASVIYHYRGASASATALYSRTFSFAKNRLITLIKNYDTRNLIRFLPPAVFLEIARVVLLLPKQSSRARAKLGALFWCLMNLKQIWKKRLYVQSFVRAVPDSEVMKYMVRPNLSLLRRRAFGALY
jgi:GT2 family glycosyltransferase